MKILKLRLLNLNSLRGETEIDFTAPPLSHHQLYAIVGPTGAGKSTLLDAMTLALYGRVERQNNDAKTGQADFDTVMTHGEWESAAEIVYEAEGHHYRSKWSVRRARKKARGKLQQDKLEVGLFDVATGAVNLVASGKRDVPDKNEELTGLNYDQFVRAVILTQGEFARFLRSKTAEKAGILEKITGTDIYAKLGKAAFNRHKETEVAYQILHRRLADVEPLGKEERTALETALQAKEKAVTGAKTEQAKAMVGLAKYERLRQLRKDATETEVARQKLTRRLAEKEPERSSLRLHDAVQPLAVLLEDERRLRAETVNSEARLAELAAQIAVAAEARAKATQEHTTAQEKLAAFTNQLPAREARIARAEKLEAEQNLLRERRAAADAERKSWERDRAQLDRDRKAAESQHAEIHKKLSGRQPAEITARAAMVRTELGQVQAQEPGLERHVKRALLERNLTVRTEEVARLQTKAKALREQFVGYEKALHAAQDEYKFRVKTLNNARVGASLQQHREQLQAGEPCPLCGAEEHPLLQGYTPTTENDLARYGGDIARAEKAVAAAEKELERMRAERSAVEAHIAEGEGRLKGLKEELQPLADLPAEERSLAEIEAELAELTTRKGALTAERNELDALVGLLPDLRELKGRMDGFAQRERSLTQKDGELKKRIKEIEGARTRVQSELRALLGEASVVAERAAMQREQEVLRAAEVAGQQTVTKLSHALTTLETERTTLTQHLAEQRKALITTGAELEQPLAELDLTLDAARAQLLPALEIAELRTTLRSLDEDSQRLAALTDRIQTQTADLQAELTDLPPEEALLHERDLQATLIDEETRLIGGIHEKLKADDARRNQAAAGATELARLRTELDRRTRLKDLIGDAKGERFRSYAQAITLRRLVNMANHHLKTINPRYRMEYAPPAEGKDKDPLNIIVIDRHQNDNRRSLSTLSGGETFLLSLALALGLSDLASGKRLIQSLFIDEGFGTLDPETLDQAMTTLEGLRDQGKMVGLISHVREIRERVQCKIVLEKLGDGVSRVRLEG